MRARSGNQEDLIDETVLAGSACRAGASPRSQIVTLIGRVPASRSQVDSSGLQGDSPALFLGEQGK